MEKYSLDCPPKLIEIGPTDYRNFRNNVNAICLISIIHDVSGSLVYTMSDPVIIKRSIFIKVEFFVIFF